MYVFIWRKLPGNTSLRVLQAVLLIAAVSALLLFVVFPFAEPRLPFDNVTINEGGGGVSTSAPSTAPSTAPSGATGSAGGATTGASSSAAVLPGGG